MKKKVKFILASFLILALLTGLAKYFDNESAIKIDETKFSMLVIDVGQADATFIKLPSGENILIDAGNYDDGDFLVGFFENLGVEKFDMVIATHPHEDHIGGMCHILDNFGVDEFYMPDVINTTSFYENMLDILIRDEIEVIMAKEGIKIEIGDAKIEMLSPFKEEYENLNHYSLVTKISYKDISYLITGDAEYINEQEMLKKYKKDLKSDIIKIPHHGSSTSSSYKFIKAVSPKWAVISCGKDNDYGHPHHETIETLNELKIQTLRTDEEGTILIESDGKEINIVTER